MFLSLLVILSVGLVVDSYEGKCKKMDNRLTRMTNKFNKKCVKKVDGGWSDYSDWTGCSTGCGIGARTRSKTCSNPAPAHGGNDCVGEAEEAQVCSNTAQCEGTCAWGESYKCETETACSWSCYNGHCWKGCNGAACDHPQDGFCSNCKTWCYLTANDSTEYAKCSTDDDCVGVLNNPCYGGEGCK